MADMSEQEREAFYDREIAPALRALSDKCRDAGLSLLAVCEWAPGEHGRTLMLQPEAGFGIRMTDAAAQANGNIDSFIIAISRHAHKHGHSSAVLHQLGVPTTPPAARERGDGR